MPLIIISVCVCVCVHVCVCVYVCVCASVAVSAVYDEGGPLFFHERGLISITACWMIVIHIPFTQLNLTSIGLGYYMILMILHDIFPIPTMRLLQPGLSLVQ
jgi:hypothetical protein